MANEITLDEFYQDLFQEIVTTSSAEHIYKEEALFDIFSEYLIDAGEFDDVVYAHYQPAQGGVRIDGYCGDPLDDAVASEANNGTLGLIILDFVASSKITTITNTDIDAIFKRACNFIEKSLTEAFRLKMEESSPGYELADLINARWSSIARIKMYLLTNKALSSRATGKESTDIEGKPVAYSVWDITRLHRLFQSGREREPLIVDFSELPGGYLRALKASADTPGNEVYLAAIPGIDLATIYDRWSTRLLEANVRVFLQARSKVNKGIRSTLENEPQLFFSFNNGLTATAEKIEIVDTDEGIKIARLENFQIVNGGQTTASIYAAYKNKVDLSRVFVQMKLSIVSPEKAKDLVPRISRSANSQNRISDADFFSNHPYHVRIETMSRRLYAPPSKEGSFVETKWYYERARGQFQDDQAYLTDAKKKRFQAEYPKAQKFTKTDLAKYLMVWTDKAYWVNRGAQKNFVEFAKQITEEWEKDETSFNEYYFRCLIAKKIIFNTAEKVVTEREWYEAGGYRSQHVVLTLALLSHSVAAMKKAIDFEKIWASQAVSESLHEAIGLAADEAHEVLMHPREGYRNISEWAKQGLCQSELWKRKVEWPEKWLEELIGKDEESEAKLEARKEQREILGIEAQTAVVEAGPEFWRKVLSWGIVHGELNEREQGILKTATKIDKGAIPTEKQCIVIMQVMNRFKIIGCPHKIRKARGHRRAR